MKTTKWIASLLAVGVLAALGAIVTGSAGSETPTAIAQTTERGPGGEYHPLKPTRIFDTRTPGINDVLPIGKKPMTLAGADFDVQVTGLAGVPSDPSEVLAVVANVTVVEPTASGWMAVRPSGTPMPDPPSSLVNFTAGRDVPNTAIVGVGANGKITVRLRAQGRAHVIIDVSGWISTSSYTASEPGEQARGARLFPVGPARLLDTRKSGGPLGARQTRSLQVVGATSFDPTIPNVVPTGASAVMVNIVAINWQRGSRGTYVTATPTPIPAGTLPTVSNVNLPGGIVKTNMAIVPIGPDGRIHFFNFAGELHLAVDVLGYFKSDPTETTTGRIVPLDAPFRALDTRDRNFGSVPLGDGGVEDWSFKAFADSVQVTTPGGAVSLGSQSALIGNLTATDLRRTYPTLPVSTYLTAYPANRSRPLVSNVNLTEGEAVPNMSLVTYGALGSDPNGVKTYNHDGSVHYVLDVYAVVLS
jgi:hypothetical protein